MECINILFEIMNYKKIKILGYRLGKRKTQNIVEN